MKFFHLSDLHIGKSVNGFSMIEEQKHVFEQVIGYIKTERPAAVLIAGDVYDRAAPSVEAVRVFDNFLTALASENVAVLIISGNHDSPERISFASRLLSEIRVFFSGVFDSAMQSVKLSDEHGDVTFWLLPFIKPLSVRGLFGGREIESCDEAVRAAIEAADIDYSARNVLLSHQFYTKAGIEPIRSESELNPIGGLDAVDSDIIERFDYAALGHLHGKQSAGAVHIRYCGSPIKYSFSECRHDKSITVVDLGEKGDLSITGLPLTPIHDMREIRGELEKLISGDVSALADRDDYLRVTLTDEDEIFDPVGKLRSVYPNLMGLSFDNSRTGIDADSIFSDPEVSGKLSPYDLFGEFFLEVQGSAMTEVQAEIVRGLLDMGDSQ